MEVNKMTVKELEASYDELRAQGATDNDILGVLYIMYQKEQINTDQLREMIDILGYEFTDEFEAMSEEDKHVKGFKEEEMKLIADWIFLCVYDFEANKDRISKEVQELCAKFPIYE